MTNIPTTTANTIFSYNEKFYGKSLEDWAQLSHKELAKESGWRCFALKR
jgi:hypothetical protein